MSANQTSDDLHIHIRDKGIGFAEVGAENGKTLASGIGPFSLRERVSDLGGTLDVRTSSKGSELDIRLPPS